MEELLRVLMSGAMGQSGEGCCECGNIENSEVGLTALSELIKRNPADITGNVKTAMLYVEEADKQAQEFRDKRVSESTAARDKIAMIRQEAHLVALSDALKDAEARVEESTKLLDALGEEGDENVMPKTQQGQMIAQAREVAISQVQRILKDLAAADNELARQREALGLPVASATEEEVAEPCNCPEAPAAPAAPTEDTAEG
jgi:hypothetical protein